MIQMNLFRNFLWFSYETLLKEYAFIASNKYFSPVPLFSHSSIFPPKNQCIAVASTDIFFQYHCPPLHIRHSFSYSSNHFNFSRICESRVETEKLKIQLYRYAVCTAMKIPYMSSFSGIARPQSRFPHLFVCQRFIYSKDRSTYFPAAE